MLQRLDNIFVRGDDFFLLGVTTFSVENDGYNQINHEALLSKIDQNGNVISSFGSNGHKTIPIEYGTMTFITIKKSEMAGNKLYIAYNYAWSFATQGTRLMKFDLGTNQSIYDFSTFSVVDFGVENEELYVTGANTCGTSGFNYCASAGFYLKKYTSSGSPDLNFANQGEFYYSFPANLGIVQISTVLIKDLVGNFTLGGKVQGYYNNQNNQNTYYNGFTMLRLAEGTLNVEDPSINDKVRVYPNPFNDVVTVTTSTSIESIELYDLNGRLLERPNFTLENKEIQIDLSRVTKGVYLLTMISKDNSSTTTKVVKN
jgi:hypothetical protein